MHTVFALLCFVVVIHWLIFPYPSGLLHWHCGNLTIAPVPAKQPWWIWINTSCEFIMSDCITTTKQSTTKPCAYFLGYTVGGRHLTCCDINHDSKGGLRCQRVKLIAHAVHSYSISQEIREFLLSRPITTLVHSKFVCFCAIISLQENHILWQHNLLSEWNMKFWLIE